MTLLDLLLLQALTFASIILFLLTDTRAPDGSSQWKKKATHFLRQRSSLSLYGTQPGNKSNVLDLITVSSTMASVFLNGFRSKVFIMNIQFLIRQKWIILVNTLMELLTLKHEHS